jgi:hypothetical protein
MTAIIRELPKSKSKSKTCCVSPWADEDVFEVPCACWTRASLCPSGSGCPFPGGGCGSMLWCTLTSCSEHHEARQLIRGNLQLREYRGWLSVTETSRRGSRNTCHKHSVSFILKCYTPRTQCCAVAPRTCFNRCRSGVVSACRTLRDYLVYLEHQHDLSEHSSPVGCAQGRLSQFTVWESACMNTVHRRCASLGFTTCEETHYSFYDHHPV